MSELILRATGKPVNKDVMNFCRRTILSTINFRSFEVGGYPEGVITKLWDASSADILGRDAHIAIVNDVCLEVTWFLMQKGYTEFTLICTDERMKLYTERSINNIYSIDWETICINIITIQEIQNMDKTFDLIIANPPFSVGNDVMRVCLPHCKEAVVLMPLSKYKKGDLYKHIVEQYGTVVWWENDSQVGAATTPIVAKLTSDSNNIHSYEDFEQKFVYRPELRKYWDEQNRRTKTYVDHICICGQRRWNEISSKTAFITGIYTPANHVGSIAKAKAKFDSGYTLEEYFEKDCWATTGKTVKKQGDPLRQYVWNFLKPNKKINEVYTAVNNGTNINEIVTIFSSEEEKDNFVQWWYSAELSGRDRNRGLASILLWGMNKPTGCPYDFMIPRVDWHKKWTDEAILWDYGFTETEASTILSIEV